MQADLPAGATEDPPPFKSEQERDQAAVTALAGVLGGFPGTRAALTATLPLASSEVRLGQLDPAIGHFEAYLRSAPSTEPLRVAALDGLGHAREAKGELPLALDAYERMSHEEAAGFEAGMGAFNRARVLVLLGKKQEAAQAFGELVSANPGTPAARMGQERLTALEAEGLPGGHRAPAGRRMRRPPLLTGALLLLAGCVSRKVPVLVDPFGRDPPPPHRRLHGRLLAQAARAPTAGVHPARVRQPRRGPGFRRGWWWGRETACCGA